MPKQIATSLHALVQENIHDSHHLRLKIAPEMFHWYCRKMPASQAKALVCEILKISYGGFESVMKKDPLEPLRIAMRDQKILEMRSEGYSCAAIGKSVKLSRVQVWRVIEKFEVQLDIVKTLSTHKIRGKVRLTNVQLESILRMKKTASVAASRQVGSQNIYFLSGSKKATAPNSAMTAPRKSCDATFSATLGNA
ncbi:MAG: hypothetical protein AAB276_06265 [Pseudomonadota bacterium]